MCSAFSTFVQSPEGALNASGVFAATTPHNNGPIRNLFAR